MTHTDVLIIGGGWAGTWAARALAGDGHAVRLLERREVLGGRAITDGPAGFRLNLGPHALYKGGAARAALAEVGLRPRGRIPDASHARALMGDEALVLPAGFVSLLTTPLLDGGARWALIGGMARAMRVELGPLAGRSIGAWLDETVRHPRARALMSMLLRTTTYASDESVFDAAAALTQLRLGLRGNVLYLDGGWGSVVASLEQAARAAGADLRTGVSATGITPLNGAELEVETSAGPLRTRAVIVAVPPAAAHQLLPGLDVSGLTPVRAAVLDLALARLPVPGQTLAFGVDRPLYYSVHSAAAALAPAGGAVVHVARYGGAGPEGEAELEGVMDRLQPGWRDQVVERRYLPRITVMYGLPRPDRARPQASGVDGVFLAGDWVGPTGLLADAALASARVAVREVRARLGAGPSAGTSAGPSLSVRGSRGARERARASHGG